VEKKYPKGLGETLCVRMLHGSREQRIQQLGLDNLPTWGIMRGTERSKIREYISFLAAKGYLEVTGGEYPVLRLTDKSRGVLFDGERVTMPVKIQPVSNQQAQRTAQASSPPRGAGTGVTGTERDGVNAIVKSDNGASASVAMDEILLTALKELRSRLAQEAGVPAYVIFTNAALSDMVQKKPLSIAEFLDISGVGEVKAKRYGAVFLQVLSQYV
jgi:ATP-dependent DNA helicase RecQ